MLCSGVDCSQMSAIYDNWERLVRATIRREELRLSALRTPSDLSLVSSSPSSSSFNFIPPSNQVSSFNFSNLSLVGSSFSYQQILQATNYLSSSNLIKNGRSGDFFYGVFEDGTQVAVKKVDLSSEEKVSFLISELEFFARVSHPNFVPVLGRCFEDSNYKFLVYKYMPNRDLYSSFNNIIGTDIGDGPLRSLDWKSRLKVAIGVAQALSHLHHQCVPPLVHRNVEASSILIDDNYHGHLGSLIEVCAEKKDKNQSRISRFLRLPKPSQRDTPGASNVTRAYDVYCFGKVLLELVTGNPVSSSCSDSEVMDWMESILPYITTNDEKLFVNIMDSYLTMDEYLLNEAWTAAIVAKACLCPKPSKRPLMKNVLEALEGCRLQEFPTDVGSRARGMEEVFRKGEIWDVPNLIVFNFAQLRAATRNFRGDGVMGEDSFGRVYKGLLPEKSTSKINGELLIAVKRLDPQSVLGLEEWQTEINMLGRLSHPNFIKLRGYCSEDKELVLVYEYLPKGSLKNHLYGRGSTIQPLSWGIRLKILIGAARGLAYLHALGRGVIYRDFKTTSILLDSSYEAKLSNFSLARMGPPENETHVTTEVLGTDGYAAPEYIATGHLSVKCDVYAFGVVMAEVLTGLPVIDTKRSAGEHNLIDWVKPLLFGRVRIRTIKDSRLEGKYPWISALHMAQLALTCLSFEPKARPSMKEVVETLEYIETNTRTFSQSRNNRNSRSSW